jgi:hypothetical protein
MLNDYSVIYNILFSTSGGGADSTEAQARLTAGERCERDVWLHAVQFSLNETSNETSNEIKLS